MKKLPEQSGIICIDKPEGFTSFDVVAKMRGIAGMRKIGHAGTLDPMATGVLPLFLGRATKACDQLPRQDKCYLAQLQLGISTDTQDITGQVLSRREVTVGAEQVEEIAARFTGAIMQVPPMYSAVKVDGKRLYELARRGEQVERAARPVEIFSLRLRLIDDKSHVYEMQVHCSKGTYVRTLAHDIGEALGCGATLTALRRTMAAGFSLENSITLERAQALAQAGELHTAVMPVEQAFASLPRVQLNIKQTNMFLNGVRMDPARIPNAVKNARMAVYAYNGVFLGLAEVAGGNFKMCTLFTLEV